MVIIMLGKNQYIKTVNAKGLFDNTYETRILQTVVNKIILNHFEKADKKPKCLLIGWDGCRADSMKYLIKSADEKISGHNESNIHSGVSALKKSGGLYITYVGGDNGLLQQTSTAQGWSCALCGKWLKPQWRTGANWSLDSISYYLIEQVKARQSYQDEDWLILIASDHGGHSRMHGSQRIEDRTTFLALSKPICEFDK